MHTLVRLWWSLPLVHIDRKCLFQIQKVPSDQKGKSRFGGNMTKFILFTISRIAQIAERFGGSYLKIHE